MTYNSSISRRAFLQGAAGLLGGAWGLSLADLAAWADPSASPAGYPIVIDGEINGQPRKLIAQASRNGWFFVLDRTNGKNVSSTEFVTVVFLPCLCLIAFTVAFRDNAWGMLTIDCTSTVCTASGAGVAGFQGVISARNR